MQNYSVNSFWTYRLEIFEYWNYENGVYFQGVINQFANIAGKMDITMIIIGHYRRQIEHNIKLAKFFGSEWYNQKTIECETTL